MPKPKVINDPQRPKPAPIEYAGQWVAWDKHRNVILAHAKTMAEVIMAARAAGELEAIVERVRRPGEVLMRRR